VLRLLGLSLVAVKPGVIVVNNQVMVSVVARCHIETIRVLLIANTLW